MSKPAPLPTTQQQFVNELNSIAYLAGLHVQRVFTDWVQMIVCALSMGSMEELYMKTVQHYAEKGKDLPSRIARLFAALVNVPEADRRRYSSSIDSGMIYVQKNLFNLE